MERIARKKIFYKYTKGKHKGVSDDRFEIPKSAEYMLLFDCEDTVLKFVYELVDKFERSDNGLIGDEQRKDVKEIKRIIKELQDNDGYRFDLRCGKEKVSSLYGRLGVLLQHLWI